MSLTAFALALGYAIGVLTTPTTEEIVWIETGCLPWETMGSEP